MYLDPFSAMSHNDLFFLVLFTLGVLALFVEIASLPIFFKKQGNTKRPKHFNTTAIIAIAMMLVSSVYAILDSISTVSFSFSAFELALYGTAFVALLIALLQALFDPLFMLAIGKPIRTRHSTTAYLLSTVLLIVVGGVFTYGQLGFYLVYYR